MNTLEQVSLTGISEQPFDPGVHGGQEQFRTPFMIPGVEIPANHEYAAVQSSNGGGEASPTGHEVDDQFSGDVA